MPSHADNHDRDKMLRWREDLKNTGEEAPPVFAIFLVSEADQVAHDVFRAFRTRFEESKLGFAHLVIFGQHGVSATARQLGEKFGLPADGAPKAVLFSGTDSNPRILELPEGANGDTGSGDGPAWEVALEETVDAIGRGAPNEGATIELLREICAELSGLH